MIEILLLGPFVDFIARMAREEGYAGKPFRQVAIMSWCSGEMGGVFLGLSLFSVNELVSLLMIYLLALAGAGVGAAVAYGITAGQPSLTNESPRERRIHLPRGLNLSRFLLLLQSRRG